MTIHQAVKKLEGFKFSVPLKKAILSYLRHNSQGGQDVSLSWHPAIMAAVGAMLTENHCPWPLLAHMDNYQWIFFHDDPYDLNARQAGIVRFLHEAWLSGKPNVEALALCPLLGIKNNNIKLVHYQLVRCFQYVHLVGKGKLIVSAGRFLYRLGLSDTAKARAKALEWKRREEGGTPEAAEIKAKKSRLHRKE